jgi:hypothetical protein
MALVINDPQCRLRWLDWGEELADPISEFLAARFGMIIRTLAPLPGQARLTT